MYVYLPQSIEVASKPFDLKYVIMFDVPPNIIGPISIKDINLGYSEQ